MKEVHIVGCGGVACCLVTSLLQTAEFMLGKPTIHLWDGDKFEKKNIARQFLANGNEGGNKADVFASHFTKLYSGSLVSHPDWFHQFAHEFIPDSLIICVSDNHAARRYCRDAARDFNVPLISGANETDSGEAWVWLREFEGTPADPWIRYPDLHKDVGVDPIRPVGCASDTAFADNPQIPAGNFMTAAGIMWLVHGLFGRKDHAPSYEHNPAEYRFCRNGWFGKTFHQVLNTGGAI